jgi:hypothetical protein
MVHHRHGPTECPVVFAAFKGLGSPLRHKPTLGSCATGGHEIWWTVTAATADEALSLLPFYVAQRTVVTLVDDVQIP